jgi:ATP-binding cassette subfamily B protein
MTKNKSPEATKLALRRYFGEIWRNRKTAIPGLLLPGIGSIFVFYLPPLVVASMLHRFGNTKPELHDTIPYLVTFAVVWLAGELMYRVAFLCLEFTDSRAIRNLYVSSMNELLAKDLSFFHDNFAGSLTKKVIGYSKNIEPFIDTLGLSVSAQVLPLLFATVILWHFSPLLVAALLGMIAVVFLIIRPLTKRRRHLIAKREAASNTTAGYVADIIGNIDAVQTFAHEDFEAKRHQENVLDYTTKMRQSWNYHTLRVDSSISPIYVLINVIGLILAILFSKNASGLTTIFITFSYFGYATRILWELNRIFRNFENAISEAAEFTELLLVPSTVVECRHPLDFVVKRGEIVFDNVGFAYENRHDDPLFKNFNLHIKPGEKLALVGHSGGGKTTVTKLLLRFMDINSGKLLIDGQNIAEARLKDLRSAIASVPQEPIMFHRSIRENIRYGRLDATNEDVVEAAKKAHADEFINKLPQGYDTLVGERGVKLSGGQRQRIAIARAIIKDAPILVLDEATSALDSESEKLIQDALWGLMANRTAVIIAHRLSTIQKMDRIIVLDDGHIAEEGSHQELLAKGGIYAKLWAHQSGGFIEE